MKRVLVTGGSRGIGAAAVRLFAAHGWQVIANYRCSEEQARTLAAETGCSLCRADVSEAEDRKKLLEFTENTFGGIDVLVNNAGISLFGLFDTIPAAEVRQMYGVNLTGTVELCRLFLPQMLRRKSGCIVNVSSVWGISGASCEVDYSAAKAAVAGLTRALAREVGPSGVRVNCVAPGVIDTDMNSQLTYEEMLALTDEIPLMRLGTAEEAAKAIFFLASDDSAYITGQVLGVDGGFC
ncbi:MAG TPA: SDR family oxidoreductase [Firmicutes bacterium]|nr:SDR family oxidoreductase [Bacillota bacterium]